MTITCGTLIIGQNLLSAQEPDSHSVSLINMHISCHSFNKKAENLKMGVFIEISRICSTLG